MTTTLSSVLSLLYLGRMVVVGQILLYLEKIGCVWAKWLYLGKIIVFVKLVLFGQNCCISAKWLCVGEMVVFGLITSMKKLLDSDWLRAMQLKSNTSAKSVIPVQKA